MLSSATQAHVADLCLAGLGPICYWVQWYNGLGPSPIVLGQLN